MKALISSIFSNEMNKSLKLIDSSIKILDRNDVTHKEKEEYLKESLEETYETIYSTQEYLKFFEIRDNLKNEKVELYEVFLEVKKEISEEFSQKYVNIYIKKFHKNIKTNKFWIKKAIYNILYEALEYCEANSTITIDIQTSLFNVYISISNKKRNEILKKTFESFDKIEESGSQGVRIGLSKYIIENLSGRIRVHSNKALGSEFILSLSKLPKSSLINRFIIFMFIFLMSLFFAISQYPIYPQKYIKKEIKGYEVYQFEDNSIVKFEKNANYKIKAKQNLYGTQYKIETILKKGVVKFHTIKNRVYFNKKFVGKGDFEIFKNFNTKIAVFNGNFGNKYLNVKNGEGVLINHNFTDNVKLLSPVENVRIKNSYLIFQANRNYEKYQIIIATDKDFLNIQDKFFTTINKIKLNLGDDRLYFIRIYGYDENNFPSMPKTIKYVNLNHYKEALYFISKNNKKEAFLELKKSLSKIKNYSSLPYFEEAKLYLKEKNYKESIKYITKALKIDKKLEYYKILFKASNKIGKLFDYKGKLFSLLQKYPNDEELLYYQVIVFYHYRNFKAAETILFKIIQKHPNYKESNKLMAEILEKLGKKDLSKYYKNLEKGK